MTIFVHRRDDWLARARSRRIRASLFCVSSYTKELTSDEIAGRFFAFNGKAQTWDESIQSLSLESLANVLISAKAAAPGRASSKSGADFCRLPTPRWESGGRRGPSSSGNSRCNRCRGWTRATWRRDRSGKVAATLGRKKCRRWTKASEMDLAYCAQAQGRLCV